MRFLSTIVLLVIYISLSKSVSVERQKRQVLDAFGLSSRPPHLRQAPLVPYTVKPAKHDLHEGIVDTIFVGTREKSWSCVTPETVVSDCFEYYLSEVTQKIISASLVISSRSSNISLVVYEVDDLFGELRYIDGFEIKEFEETHHFDLTKHFQSWMQRRYAIKMIKIEILNSITLDVLDLHDSLSSSPHFEITVFTPNEVTEDECTDCCLVPFYVNFTEIGWNDWILSPPGFWANYCAGSCSTHSDDTYQFLKSLNNPMIPEPKCAPNYYGSVDMIVALGPRDIRKTRVHGLRALSCSCT